MRQSIMLVATTLALAHATRGQSPDQENPLARAALDVFATKCVQCHGTEVPHPKATFGFVNDLNRLVASGKYVVPGQPDKSELWKAIDEGDMPPDKARAGPLVPAEKDAVLRWIVGGAPPLDLASGAITWSPESKQAPSASTGAPNAPADPPPKNHDRATVSRLVVLLGRLHVIVIHFPIALLLVAAVAEAWEMHRRSSVVLSSVRLCVALGAIASLVAAGLGWIHALDGFAGPLSSPTSITGLHRWIGTALGVAAPVVAWLSERAAAHARRSLDGGYSLSRPSPVPRVISAACSPMARDTSRRDDSTPKCWRVSFSKGTDRYHLFAGAQSHARRIDATGATRRVPGR